MTPGILDVPIYKKARFQHTLTFYQGETDNVVDLTGLTPFVCVLSHIKTNAILATLTVTETDLTGGQITITATAAQTSELTLGPVRIGLRDVNNDPYIACTLQVVPFAPDPA